MFQRGHATTFYSNDSGSTIVTTSAPNLPTDSTSSPIATNSPDPASTGDQETDPTTTNALSTSTTHDPDDHDTTSSPSPASTYDQERGTNTSTTTPIKTSTSQEGLDILPYAMGGAVGGTVVIITILSVVVIVSLLVRKSREKSHKVESNKNIGLLTYNNALYDIGKETDTCNAQIGSCIVLYIAWPILMYSIIWYQFILQAN